jgi:hypothetical protein
LGDMTQVGMNPICVALPKVAKIITNISFSFFKVRPH